jgi:hypothetical protein
MQAIREAITARRGYQVSGVPEGLRRLCERTCAIYRAAEGISR